jgi:hypothetical protein
MTRDQIHDLQHKNLRLKPWELPPVSIGRNIKAALESDNEHERAAVRLAKRMRDLGVPLDHPDPAAAIEEAEARRRKDDMPPVA